MTTHQRHRRLSIWIGSALGPFVFFAAIAVPQIINSYLVGN